MSLQECGWEERRGPQACVAAAGSCYPEGQTLGPSFQVLFLIQVLAVVHGPQPTQPRDVSDLTSSDFPPLSSSLQSHWLPPGCWTHFGPGCGFPSVSNPLPLRPRPNPARAQSLATTLLFRRVFPWTPLALFPCFIFLQRFYHSLINHSFFLFVHLMYCLSSPPRLRPTWWLALIFFFF